VVSRALVLELLYLASNLNDISVNVTRGVSDYGLAKKYLKAKEEFWKLKYFTMQKYNLQKTL
jgi:hypothetical protein